MSKNYVFTAQTLIGDGVVVSFAFVEISNPLSALQLYRCYAVWQSKLVMILPVLLWCATVGTYDVCFQVNQNH